jgi:hypothetical protein
MLRRVISLTISTAIAVGTALMAANSFTLAQQPEPRPPLTTQQRRMIAEKAEYLKSIGADAPAVPFSQSLAPPPTRTFSEQIHMPREHLEAEIQQEADRLEDRWAEIRRSEGEIASQAARANYVSQRLADIQAVGPEGLTLDVPGVEAGTHSITWSQFSYISGQQSDPTNVIWWGVGGAAHVEYVLRNWTDGLWENDAAWPCQSVSQSVYLWEASHTGGTDHWKTNDWGAQRVPDLCGYGTRVHARVFGADVFDSHAVYGYWSVGAAHYEQASADPLGHAVLSWETGENEVLSAFVDASGNLLWFVGGTLSINFGNAGTYNGQYNDGWGKLIQLTN